MWHSRPPRDPPPLHGKCHLKFPFWFFAHLPYLFVVGGEGVIFKAILSKWKVLTFLQHTFLLFLKRCWIARNAILLHNLQIDDIWCKEVFSSGRWNRIKEIPPNWRCSTCSLSKFISRIRNFKLGKSTWWHISAARHIQLYNQCWAMLCYTEIYVKNTIRDGGSTAL